MIAEVVASVEDFFSNKLFDDVECFVIHIFLHFESEPNYYFSFLQIVKRRWRGVIGYRQ